jgi:hypothetical protein
MRGSTPDVKAAILKSIASGGCILLASKRTPEGCYELSTSKLIAWTLGVIAGTTIGGKIWFIKPNGKIILRQPSCKKMLEEVN